MSSVAITLEAAIARHLVHLKVGGFTAATQETRAWILGLFRHWAEERGVVLLAEVTPELIARYQRHLSQHRKEDGQPLASRTQRTRLMALRMFGRWVRREKLLEADPAAALVMPRVGQALPKAWLSAAQTETVLALPKVEGSRRPAPALRDRAIMETLYSTGLRRLEVSRLTAADVDFAGGVVLVRQGKGRKDRVVAIGERALLWLGKYLAEARPKLAKPGDEAGPLFVTEKGGPLTGKYISAMVTRYVARSGLGKVGSCHLFRHTCATLMLEHGADIRHVQEQLGHACLQTTQIYTHVSIRKLKEVHAATHPGASLSAPKACETQCGNAALPHDHTGSLQARQPDAAPGTPSQDGPR
jgi:integrase/recombinase XerD